MSGDRARQLRLRAFRVAWLVLYPTCLGLVLLALPARYAELTGPRTAASVAQPTGGSYGLALFALEVSIIAWYVANTLLMAWRRPDDWVALYVSIGGPTYVAFAAPTLDALAAADPRWSGA